MKIFLTILFSSLLFTNPPKKKIIFFGDSIIELAVKPGGFIPKLDSTFEKKGLGKNYELIGSGISSNKVYDLYLRMDEDVLAKAPDAVFIWIGVNDVWHKRLFGTGTDADKFERFYNAIIKKQKEKNITVILCTPAVIGEKWDNTNEQDGDLNKYSNIIRNLAQKNNLTLIDFRKDFTDYLKLNNPDNKDRGILTYDGVHLSALGHNFVATKLIDIISKL